MMNNELTITEAHLWRYFAGQATSEEIDMLAAWVQGSELHQAEFQRVKELFYNTAYAPIRKTFDGKKAFNGFQKSTNQTARFVALRPWISVAAIVTVLFGSSIFFVFKNHIKSSATSLSYVYNSAKPTFTLPDKSTIELNKNSSLQYKTEVTDKRSTSLIGEAYFDISHNAQRPFEIEAGKIKVKVLGTAFNVNARNVDSIVVSVTRGRVQLQAIDDETKSVILTVGQSAYFSRNEFSSIKTFYPNALAWKEKVLLFDATPLSEVVSTLGNYFDTKLLLDSKNRNQQLTVKLIEPKLDSVLQLLQVMYNLQTAKTSQGIILKDMQRD
jgi:transmembrane sensor